MLRFIRRIVGFVFVGFGLLLGLLFLPAIIDGDRSAGAMIIGGIALVILLFGARLVLSNRTGGNPFRGSWRSDPATDKQKSFADELGIKYPRNITKGELSDLITKVTGK